MTRDTEIRLAVVGVVLIVASQLVGCATCPVCVPEVRYQTVEVRVPVPQSLPAAPAPPITGLVAAALTRGAPPAELLAAMLAEHDDLVRYVAEDAALHAKGEPK